MRSTHVARYKVVIDGWYYLRNSICGYAPIIADAFRMLEEFYTTRKTWFG